MLQFIIYNIGSRDTCAVKLIVFLRAKSEWGYYSIFLYEPSYSENRTENKSGRNKKNACFYLPPLI